MKIRCIAIDDEPLALRQMSDFIRKTPFLEEVAACSSAIDAARVVAGEEVDLMFVDINMPELNGLEFVRSLENGPEVIFTTAYSEFAIEGFKVAALDYLLKPIGYPDFLRAANKAQHYFETQRKAANSSGGEEDFLFVKSEYRVLRINFDDIKYVEGMREYVRIHTLSGERIMSLMSMKALVQKLPAGRFMRVHRSYLVNLKCIERIERGRILFDKDVVIPVGEQYKEAFQQFVDAHFL